MLSSQVEVLLEDVFVTDDINGTVSWSASDDPADATYCPVIQRALDSQWVFRCNYTGIPTTNGTTTAELNLFFVPKSSTTEFTMPVSMVALPYGEAAGEDYSPPASLNQVVKFGSLGMLSSWP